METKLQSLPLPRGSREVPLSPQVQAAAVVMAYLRNTQRASHSRAFEVLQVMAEGTLQRADRGGSTDFGALNLRTLVAPKVTKDPSGWLSPLWSRLLKEEEKWQEGMADTARREGLAFVPRLEKLPGSPAIYRIQGEPLPTDELIDPAPTVPVGGIYYTPESISAPGAFLSSA